MNSVNKKMKIKIQNVMLVISVIISIALVFYARKKENTFSCSSHVDYFFPKGSLHTDFQVLMYNDESGLIIHRGSLIIEHKKYLINRQINFIVENKNKGGVLTLKLTRVEKNPNDNVPDEESWNKSYSPGLQYYPLVSKTKGGDIIITENASPLYVCSQDN